jgi:hypothetical protein
MYICIGMFRSCNKPGCKQEGTKGCSACNVSKYCSPECQKKDWKIHKLVCPLENSKLLSYEEGIKTINDLIVKSKNYATAIEIRIYKSLQRFGEKQFGEPIDKKTFRYG